MFWFFRAPVVSLLVSPFPQDDPMSLQICVSTFYVISTRILLPFVKQLAEYSCRVIRDKKSEEEVLSLKYADNRLISMPPVALSGSMTMHDDVIRMLEIARKTFETLKKNELPELTRRKTM